jgi:nitrilase
MTSRASDLLTVAVAQITPIWLQREATLEKMVAWVGHAASEGAALVAFSEGLLPGYPFWVEHTDGARFESPVQQRLFAHYVEQSVQIDAGHLAPLCAAAARHGVWVVCGIIERDTTRGLSLFASMVTIDASGVIVSVHRKLMPTHEERLVWSPGDAHGLRCHALGRFRLGSLNCWENWMPLARAALYGQGESLHVASWPGSHRNTGSITPFIAREGRSYALSASSYFHRDALDARTPDLALLRESLPEVMADGGSCIAGPDGRFVVDPVVGSEQLVLATIDHARVREERQNFDPFGHYSRPELLSLGVDRRRRSGIELRDA